MNWLSSNVNTVDRYASIEKVFTKVKLTINNAFVLRLLDMGMKMLRMIMMLGVDVLPDKILGFTWHITEIFTARSNYNLMTMACLQ